ncbi:MAG: hypothetical protein JNK85_01030 [Verrucomicrobiales bacterium]|nr:hypothetical protein [Verrucomicrobiales bacterium]
MDKAIEWHFDGLRAILSSGYLTRIEPASGADHASPTGRRVLIEDFESSEIVGVFAATHPSEMNRT